MVRIQAEKKRAFLRSLYRQTKAGGGTSDAPFIEILNAFQEEAIAPVKTGQLVLSTSGGGYATSLKIPQGFSQLTEEEIVGLSELFINVYDAAVAAGAVGDAAIFTAMLLDVEMNGYNVVAGLDVTMLDAARYGYR